MTANQTQLERENRYALTAVQALLGLIAASVEAVALQIGEEALVLRFWTSGEVSEILEDAEDAVGDMEAFLWPETALIQVEVLSGSPPSDVYEWAGRMLYRAKTTPEQELAGETHFDGGTTIP